MSKEKVMYLKIMKKNLSVKGSFRATSGSFNAKISEPLQVVIVKMPFRDLPDNKSHV